MIYDCFTFFNELDLLEIRLNILDPYVDRFILTESTETFSGQRKPLYYLENEERFAKWKDKIVHIVAPRAETPISFERAGFQKNFFTGISPFEDDDIVYFGDLDEIWNPQVIEDDRVYNLQQLNYSYYFNNRSSEDWVGTIVGRWGTIKTESVNHWRATHTHELPNGGWHFTNMGGLEQIKKKLEAYDHQEFNNDYVKSSLEERIASGQDYVGRTHDWKGKPFEFFVDESDLPEYLLDNKEKYAKYFK